jgi:DNA polymerase (family 10)
MPVSKSKISSLFELGAALMELLDENPFKIRNWQQAAINIDKFSGNPDAATDEELSAALGKAFAAKVREIVTSGALQELEVLKNQVPEGVVQMLSLPGLGPKKVRQLWKEYNITTLHSLQDKAKNGELAKYKGFGEKTQQSILEAIAFQAENAKRLRLNQALNLAQEIETYFSTQLPAMQLERTQALIVKPETVNELCWITDVDFVSTFEHWVYSYTEKQISGIKQVGLYTYNFFFSSYSIPCTITFEKRAQIPYRVFTGSASPAFKHALLAKTNNAIGLLKPGTFLSSTSFFTSIDVPDFDPVLWESPFVDHLLKNHHHLLQVADLKGTIHNHSTYSDGQNTLEEMALAAKSKGLQYLGIADHSQTATYAQGLTEEQVLKQHAEIEQLNKQLDGFHIFKGIESDILPDGALDYPDEVLATFDFVVASIHSGLSMDTQKATERLIKAIENPYTTILGHPTGRLLLKREGYKPDMQKIIDACAANGVCIEINANPWRLDIDWRWIPYCMERGVLISINPDAHETAGYYDTIFGVWMAQKGGLTKEMTLNALNVNELSTYFSQKKK